MTGEIPLSVLIVNYNSGEYLLNTVKSLLSSDIDTHYELIIVDNNSSDKSLDLVSRQFPDITIIKNDINYGFAKANNIGAKHCLGEYILFLNSDTIVSDRSIDILLNRLRKNKDIGIISPVLLHGDGEFQLSFGRDISLVSEFFLKYLSKLFYKIYIKLKKGKIEKDVHWVSGACFLMKRSLYNEIGGFDENFFIYMEDADLCRRVRKSGYKIHVTSDARIIHLLGKSTGKVFKSILPEIKKSQLYYYKKHNGKLSLGILKIYLTLKFTFLKYLGSNGKSKENKFLIEKVLRIIKNFK